MNSGLTGALERAPDHASPQIQCFGLLSLGPGPCFIADRRWVLDQAPSFHVTGSILPLFVL